MTKLYANCLWIMCVAVSNAFAMDEKKPPEIAVRFADKTSTSITQETFAALHTSTSNTRLHDRHQQYQGYSLYDILQTLNATTVLAKKLQLVRIVRICAVDEYCASFTLADLDPTIGNKAVYLVLENDLWRLVVPDDKKPARWVKNVSSIELVDM